MPSALKRPDFRLVRSLFRDESGSEIAEYALVLSLFAVICIVIVQATASTANGRVETDETNYTNAFVNGY